MWRRTGIGGIVLSVLLVSCTLTRISESPQIPVTSTVPPLPSPPLAAASEAPPQTVFPTLESDTGPYANTVSLLDHVCYEYLYEMDGQTWLWTTYDDLTAFYDRVDAAETCFEPVERSTFDFSRFALVGLVNVSTGCDAAHRFVALVQDDTTQTQTLTLEYDVRLGCGYELVQPFLIAIPHPPKGYTFHVVLTYP